MNRSRYPFLAAHALRRLRGSVSYLWLVAFAGYLMVSAGQSMYRSYQGKQETARLQDQLAAAILERERLTALLVYYQTDSFKEKELRRSLLLKKPGETVYALPEVSPVRSLLDDTVRASEAQAEEATPAAEPTWRQWVRYVVGR